MLRFVLPACAIACTALTARLTITCCSCVRSASTFCGPECREVRDGHTARFHLVTEEQQRLADDVVERQQRLLGHAPGRHGTNAANDFGCPPRIGDHALCEFPHLVDIGRGSSQPAQAGFTARGDRRKRLIDLVGDGGGELAQHRDARGMGKVRPQALKLFFSANLLGQIDHAHESDRQALDRLWPGGRRTAHR